MALDLKAGSWVHRENASDVNFYLVTKEVYALIGRVLGQEFVASFDLTLANSSKVKGEYFELSTSGSDAHVRVHLAGNTPVNIASALNYYLKYYCLCSFTWTGNQCQLSAQALPKVDSKVTIHVQAEYRYYMNVCTFGYSTVWWQWDRWEQEIDWMALNGYNMPLAFIGQEYVWLEVYESLGLKESDVLAWLTGAAFLPWQRMGNVNSWASPLTMAFVTAQRDLQVQILARMRTLGMRAVLPGFAGHVPTTLNQTFPEANITVLGSWNGFPGTSYLSPTDPLYSSISTKFVASQTAIYGTDHLYNVDPFNELTPPSSDPGFLRNTSAMIYQSLKTADSQATWVLQSWFLVNEAWWWQPPQAQAFLQGIPIGGLLVLDLFADVDPAWNMTQPAFYGHSWIWCMINNFGGRSGMYGKIPHIASAPIIARAQSPGCVGTGLAPEAIEQNVIVYDLMNEMSWRSTPPNLTQWTADWSVRRYGSTNPSLVASRSILIDTVYNCNIWAQGPPLSFVGQRPTPNMTANLYYDPNVVELSWDLLLQAAQEDPSVLATSTFSFDLAEITMQALSNRFMTAEIAMYNAFAEGDAITFGQMSDMLGNIIEGMDQISGTQQMLLIGNWTARAKAWGTLLNESTQSYEFNARNQVTLWGPATSELNDYAYKLWSGLIGDFYYMRWELYIKMLHASIYNPSSFDQSTFISKVQQLEYAWDIDQNLYPDLPVGDILALSTAMKSQTLL
eukprot:gene16886-20079_t